MDDIPWTDKRDHKYWYTIKCPCGAEGEIGLPIAFRGTFGCPDDESGCMATYIQWDSPEGIRVKCVVEPVYAGADTREDSVLGSQPPTPLDACSSLQNGAVK